MPRLVLLRPLSSDVTISAYAAKVLSLRNEMYRASPRFDLLPIGRRVLAGRGVI